MNSIAIGEYKSINIENPRGGYREPFVITIKIHDKKKWPFYKAKHCSFKIP
jgi:hypothetical protein